MRTVKDARLATRSERLSLPPNRLHRRLLDQGLHLGYRRGKRSGRWLVRIYNYNQTYVVKTLGNADDFGDADGIHVYNFSQAQELARLAWSRHQNGRTKVGDARNYTVDEACDAYVAARHNAQYVGSLLNRHVRPKWGNRTVASLQDYELQVWLNGLAKEAPGGSRSKRHDPKDAECVRKREASANVIWANFRACLNHALKAKTISREGWREVRQFRQTQATDRRYLTQPEIEEVLEECNPSFGQLVRGALLTGARVGELCALQVCDFDAASGQVHIRRSKNGRPRRISLNDAGKRLFQEVCADGASDEYIFTNRWGDKWRPGSAGQALTAVLARTNIALPMDQNFHVFRHTYASHAVMAGMNLMVLAKLLGHRDTRMIERHYGHLSPDFISKQALALVPSYGI